MAFLGKRADDEDDDERGGETFALNLDDLVCPVCGRELPPWVSACPDDGAEPVQRAQTTDRTPEIPAHLLEGLDDEPAPGRPDTDEASHDDGDGQDTDTA